MLISNHQKQQCNHIGSFCLPGSRECAFHFVCPASSRFAAWLASPFSEDLVGKGDWPKRALRSRVLFGILRAALKRWMDDCGQTD